MEFSLQQMLTHALGFLIFLAILSKFAWRPLLNLLEERRQKIEQEFQTIEEEKGKAEGLVGEYEDKLKKIDAERRAKLVEGVDEGKRIAARIESEARAKAQEIHEKAKADIEREVAKARVQLKDELVTMTMSAAEKILHEKLDEQKDRELIGRYIDNLEKA